MRKLFSVFLPSYICGRPSPVSTLSCIKQTVPGSLFARCLFSQYWQPCVWKGSVDNLMKCISGLLYVFSEQSNKSLQSYLEAGSVFGSSSLLSLQALCVFCERPNSVPADLT